MLKALGSCGGFVFALCAVGLIGWLVAMYFASIELGQNWVFAAYVGIPFFSIVAFSLIFGRKKEN